MHSVRDTSCEVGCPIRRSTDHCLVTGSLWLIAGSNVLHRLSMPSHPPCALSGLITPTGREDRTDHRRTPVGSVSGSPPDGLSLPALRSPPRPKPRDAEDPGPSGNATDPLCRPSPKRTTAEPLRRGSHREGVGTYETLRDTRIHNRNPSNRPPGDGRRDSGPAGWTRSEELGVREARVRRVSALVRIRMSKRLGMIRRPPGVPQAEAGEP
jgi:hypothetical protein